MIAAADVDRLAGWLRSVIPGAEDVRCEAIERPEAGNSSDSLLMTLAWQSADGGHRQPVVLRRRPPSPALLEPYDISRQVEILRRIESSGVRAPRILWFESTGSVLGREFYLMDRLAGTVYEMSPGDPIRSDPDRVSRMCGNMLV
jgi:aminoglycoside phosphotransferase (APT) family kinase protein